MMALKIFDKDMKFSNFDDLVLSDDARPPSGYELVGFRIAMQYVEHDDEMSWKLSQPVHEKYAVEFESQIRETLGDMVRTQLRPVWGKEVVRDDNEYQPPAPSHDENTVSKAYEAAKYLNYVARNKPEDIVEALDVAARYADEVLCGDYKVYENRCRRAGLPAMPHGAAHCDERLHA